MSDLYDTHEQGERVKSWLQENGGAIVTGLIVAFGVLYGFKQWQAWETSKGQQASAEYQVMLSSIEAGNMDAAVPNYEVLKSEYPKSAYTSMASMIMAKARLQAGQMELAAVALTHAMHNAQPDAIKPIARTRLARVKLAQGDSAAALELLDDAPSVVGLESQFAEIRGDIHLTNGAVEQAIQSYETALNLLQEGVGNKEWLTVKLEALKAGVAESVDVEPDADGGDM